MGRIDERGGNGMTSDAGDGFNAEASPSEAPRRPTPSKVYE